MRSQTERLELIATLTHDFITVPRGGLINDTGNIGNLDLVSNLVLWEKGRFHFQGLFNYGDPLSQWMGDVQVANNMEAPKGYKTYELWYEQEWDKLLLRIGQQEINNRFAWTENGLLFINSSFGIGPEFTLNIPVSTFPFTGLGITFVYNIHQDLHLRMGLFDGDPGLDAAVPWKKRMVLSRSEGSFGIGELQWSRWGQHRLGVWRHSTQKGQQQLWGSYLLGDIPLHKKQSQEEDGWGLFYQLGWTPKNAPVVSHYQGIGIVYRGLFASNKDAFGVAFGRAQLSSIRKQQLSLSNTLQSEQVLEFTYAYTPKSFIQIQPNWQYVLHPASQKEIANASVFMLRVILGAL